MIVFIPIKSTDILDPRVSKSISVQSIQSEITLIENTPLSICRRKGEFEGRDKIRNLASTLDDDFVVINDADIQHQFADNFICMFNFLREHIDYGAICLRVKMDRSTHIRMASSMWRTKVLSQMPLLDVDTYDRCFCDRYKVAVEALDLKLDYLDNIIRVKEVQI